MQEMITTRWPKMARVQQDKRVELLTGRRVVRHWWQDRGVAEQVARRSQCGYLAEWTVPLERAAEGWYESELVDGYHPRSEEDFQRCFAALATIHSTERREKRDVTERHCERVCSRLRENHPTEKSLLTDVHRWFGRQMLVDFLGPWHGDPSASNILLVSGPRRVTFVDHAPQWYGGAKYDFAKLRRSMIIDDDANTLKPPDHGDAWLAVVIAGMLGSHAKGDLWSKLAEIWLKITG